ncbi:MAG: tetratricopeptide repeat protein [Chitinophagales bacterium]|nr:tetratricopeptide repeat protein [Chitinophagales bacterium]
MKYLFTLLTTAVILLSFTFFISCTQKVSVDQQQIDSLELLKGELALCGPEQFGSVNFGLDCMESVQEDFELAIALLHSFEYSEAEKVFASVIASDPKCAIAYWGVAMCNYHQLWSPPKEEALEKSSKAISIAQALNTKNERESLYIDAIAQYYKDWQNIDHKTRSNAYVNAMEKIYKAYPDDKEAAIFYALALNSIVDPSDKEFTNQRAAGEILNKIFPQEPNHPGVAHYIIHSYDYPELAHLALNSARKYADIAPSSAHAQHMPSHIFTRLGLWEESIESNMRSATSAQCYMDKLGVKGNWFNELHALDYLMYAYLQTSQIDKADEILNYTLAVEIAYPFNLPSAYALAAIPARHAIEMKDWKKAAELELPLKNSPWEKFPWEASIINFSSLLGAVHVNDLEKAKSQLANLKTNYAILNEANDEYKSNQVNIQIKISEGWIAFAEGDNETAETSLLEAADMEENTAKHPVTPGEVIPARELLGELYLLLEDYGKALQAFEMSLTKSQNRFHGTYGAAFAAEKYGDNDKALKYFSQLIELSKDASNDRPEIVYARDYIDRHDQMISMN